jgi:polysaccharide biosynthesis protein PslG
VSTAIDGCRGSLASAYCGALLTWASGCAGNLDVSGARPDATNCDDPCMGKQAQRDAAADARARGDAGTSISLDAGGISDAPPDGAVITLSPVPSKFGLSSSAEATVGFDGFLPRIQEIGCKELRLFAEWAGIEATEGSYDFASSDARVRAAAAVGIETSGLFFYSTDWLLPKNVTNRKTFPVDRLDAWGSYCGRAVAQYKGLIRHWEVWNEPNSPAFNGGSHSPADYAKLVAAAFKAAKQANADARIGLNVANYDVRYLSQVIAALAAQNAADSFDFLAVHPYDLVTRMLAPDGELQFLAMVDNLRRMLKQSGSKKLNAPVRFTELGARIGSSSEGVTVDEAIAAQLLLKSYVLGIVQGAEQIDWFEVMDAGGSQGHGLLDAKLTARASHRAYASLTQVLGPTPVYRGWMSVAASGRGYGFVFGQPSAAQLVAWMPRALEGTLAFDVEVEVTDPLTGVSMKLPAKTNYVLGDSPVLVSGVPAPIVELATANAARPFPWGSAAESANLATLAPGAERGAVLDQAASTTITKLADGSQGFRINPGSANKLYLSVSPSFANYDTHDVYVRVRARPDTSTANAVAKLNLWYQPASGPADAQVAYPYQSASESDWEIRANGAWQTFVWHVTDAMFVHTFGYGLYLQLEGPFPLLIGKVELSKVPFTN